MASTTRRKVGGEPPPRDASGKVTEREVKVGVMNRVSAQIVSGLEPDEKVVIGSKAKAPAAQAQTGSALVPSAGRTGGRP